MMNLIQAMRCKITARRLSRYVDMDFSATLSAADIDKVRRHLSECEKCTATVGDLTKIKSSLRRLGTPHLPDASSLARLKATLDDLSHRQE